MIYLLTRDENSHSGMKTYAAGLSEIAGNRLQVVSLVRHKLCQPKPGDWVLFNDQICPADRDCIATWGAKIHYALLLHSPLLQMDLSSELARTLVQIRSSDIDLVLCADRETARLIDQLLPGIRAEWLPHCLPQLSTCAERYTPNSPIQSPLLCWMPMTLPDSSPYYRHKNPFCQIAGVALASTSLGRPINVVANYASDLLCQFAEQVNVPLQLYGSLDPEAHLDFLRDVTVGLCTSLSESFSYNVAELMILGTPALFGPAVGWAWKSPKLVQHCGITAPGSSEEIAIRLEKLLGDGRCYERARIVGREVALKTLHEHHAQAERKLQQLINYTVKE